MLAINHDTGISYSIQPLTVYTIIASKQACISWVSICWGEGGMGEKLAKKILFTKKIVKIYVLLDKKRISDLFFIS